MPEKPLDELLMALGNAVAMVWGRLPVEAQHDLFEKAVQSSGEGIRERLAVFLHDQHPRTSVSREEARQAPEPDSLGG